MSQLLSQLDEIILFFQPIRITWLPKSQILKEVLLAVKNVPNAPQIMGTTCKNYNLFIKDLPHIEDEKKELIDIIYSFMGFKSGIFPLF